MNKVIVYNPPIKFIKERILEAGSKIGNVWFNKREDNSLRKMCYKLKVIPKNKVNKNSTYKRFKKDIDKVNNQMTVYDVNKVLRNKSGDIVGRGAYRTIPLDRVIRIVSCGIEYEIRREWD